MRRSLPVVERMFNKLYCAAFEQAGVVSLGTLMLDKPLLLDKALLLLSLLALAPRVLCAQSSAPDTPEPGSVEEIAGWGGRVRGGQQGGVAGRGDRATAQRTDTLSGVAPRWQTSGLARVAEEREHAAEAVRGRERAAGGGVEAAPPRGGEWVAL